MKRHANPPMKHFVVAYFEAFQDGALTDAENRHFQQHLADCQQCHDWVDRQENIIERLRMEASPQSHLSPTAAERVQRNLYNRMRRAMIMRNGKTFIGAATAVAVLTVIVGFFVLQAKNLTTEETVPQITAELVAAEATNEQLIKAVIANDATAVKQLLEAGVSPDAVDSDGDPILKSAILGAESNGNTDIVELLVKYGADVNVPDSKGYALLPQATLAGQLEVVQLLLDAGADVHGIMTARTLAGFTGEQTALVIAADRGHIEIVKLLIAYGVDVNQISGTYKGVALHLAAWENHPEIVQILLDNGADPDVYNTWDLGETPLHYAVRNHSYAAVQALLEGGADMDIRFRLGKTALMEVIRSRNIEMATIILDEGADPNLQDDAGNTALHYAVSARQSEIIPILIEHGAILNVENNAGKTALDIAATDEIIEILSEASTSE